MYEVREDDLGRAVSLTFTVGEWAALGGACSLAVALLCPSVPHSVLKETMYKVDDLFAGVTGVPVYEHAHNILTELNERIAHGVKPE